MSCIALVERKNSGGEVNIKYILQSAVHRRSKSDCHADTKNQDAFRDKPEGTAITRYVGEKIIDRVARCCRDRQQRR